jgi:hypothetical protein
VLHLLSVLMLLAGPATPPDAIDLPDIGAVPDDITVRTVAPEELPALLEAGNYRSILLSELKLLLRSLPAAQIPTAVANRPSVNRAVYRATLTAESQLHGTLLFDVDEALVAKNDGALRLGQTTLLDLQLNGGGQALIRGKNASGQLFVLMEQGLRKIDGSWKANGTSLGDSTIFRLELPQASVAELELTTPTSISVTSPNALVLSPKIIQQQGAEEAVLLWRLFPNTPGRINLSCRRRVSPQLPEPLVINGLTAAHIVNDNTLKSRWSFSVPAFDADAVELTCRISTRTRITDVRVNDSGSAAWSIDRVNDQQVITVTIPRWTSVSTVTIGAVSVLANPEEVAIPFLLPREWWSVDKSLQQSDSTGRGLATDGIPPRGPVVFAPSTFTLAIPASMNLEQWKLSGVQERDVSSLPDGKRIFQLTRVATDAEATARVGTTEPRVTDSVLAILTSQDRTSTMRCLVHVTCADAAAVQLEWPVSRAWRPVFARYASNSRALYFEQRATDEAGGPSQLVVHLPEALEPNAHRILEFEFQLTQSSPDIAAELPLRRNQAYKRQTSGLVIESTSAGSRAARRPGSGSRRVVDRAELLASMPWLPAESVPQSGVTFIMQNENVSADGSLAEFIASNQTGFPVADDITRIVDATYEATLDETGLTETTRLSVPVAVTDNPDDGLLFQAAPCEARSMTCRVDGQQCLLTPVQSGTTDGWQFWRVTGFATAAESDERDFEFVCVRDAAPRLEAILIYPAFAARVVGTGTLRSETTRQLIADESMTAFTSEGNDNDPPATIAASRRFEIPPSPERLQFTIRSGPSEFQQLTIRQHVRHLIQNVNQTLHHQALGVIDVSGGDIPDSLLLTMRAEDVVCVSVNNKSVTALSDGEATRVPLPTSGRHAMITILWKQPATQRGIGPASTRLTPIVGSDSSTTTSHVLMIDPALVPAGGMLPQLNDVAVSSANLIENAAVSPPEQTTEQPRAIAAFLSRWQLSESDDWQRLGLVQSGAASELQLRFSSRRTLHACLGLAAVISILVTALLIHNGRFRAVACVIMMAALLAQYLSASAIVESLATGVFWGIAATLMWFVGRRNPTGDALPGLFSQLPAGLLILLTPVVTAQAQPPGNSEPVLPDLIVSAESIGGVPMAWVRQPLSDAWQAEATASQPATPAYLLTRSQVLIEADSLSDVAVTILIDVRTRSATEEQWLQLDTGQCSLVSCEVDGLTVLPVRTGKGNSQSRIAVPLVPMQAITPRPLVSPESAQEDSSAGSPAVFSQPQWRTYNVRLALRPSVQLTATGSTFRVPLPDAPQRSLRFVEPPGELTSAIAETAGHFSRWTAGQSEQLQLGSGSASDELTLTLMGGRPTSNVLEPAVTCAMVSEVVSGQHAVTALLSVPLNYSASNDLRMHIPEGYRAVTAGTLPAGEVFWTTTQDSVVIQNPASMLNGRIVVLQLVSSQRANPHQQTIPFEELFAASSVPVTGDVLLAVRTAPEFIVQSVEADGNATMAVSDIPENLSSLIRRTDVLFELPLNTRQSVIRQRTRVAVSEARIREQVTLSDEQALLTVDADIETSVHFAFRHRVRIPESCRVQEVSVTAGEANRLHSWQRHGELLVVQLKEATSGLHKLTIRGSMDCPPSDEPLELRPPVWENIQILESDLTITDNSTTGFVINQLGAAVPEELMEAGTQLPSATPVRLQIVGESEPVILRKLKPIEKPSTDADDSTGSSATIANARPSADAAGIAAADAATLLEQPGSDAADVRENRDQPLSDYRGSGLSVNLICTGGSANPAGKSLIIARPVTAQRTFDIRIPESIRVTSIETSPGVEWVLQENMLSVKSADALAELLLHWVSTRHNPTWARMDVDLALPNLTDMRASYFVSVADTAPDNDPQASLLTFSAETPSLSAIEMESQLRLELTTALNAIDPLTGKVLQEEATVGKVASRTAALQQDFLNQIPPGKRTSEELLHFNLGTTSRFHATAVRVPGMQRLLPFLLAIGLIGLTSVIEAKRRLGKAVAAAIEAPEFQLMSDELQAGAERAPAVSLSETKTDITAGSPENQTSVSQELQSDERPPST